MTKNQRSVKKMNRNKHIGSNFDDFLKEEGILQEIEAAVCHKLVEKTVKRARKA
ncbi:MAG: hypothetical protein RL235_25 [Chlamydiota bacterium]